MSDVFSDMVICASGTLSIKKKEFQELIEENGGEYAENFKNAVTIIVSTDEDVENRTTKIKKGIEKKVPIVSMDWINACIKKGEEVDKGKYLLYKPDDNEEEEEKPKTKKKITTKKRKQVDEDEEKPKITKKVKEVEEDEEDEDEDSSIIFRELVICVSGKLSKSMQEWKTFITSNGGVYVTTVTKNCTHLITNGSEVKKQTKKVQEAIERKIPVVDEKWLIDSENVCCLSDVDSYLINVSEIEVSNKTEKSEIKEKGEEKTTEKKPITKTKKVTIKGGAPVDELSGKQNTHHVYVENGQFWDCMLNQTNTKNNNNKYYKIQLLESDSSGSYYVFTKWGRVGEERKSNTGCEAKSTIDQAKKFFQSKFKAKTKNDWDDRDNFVHHKGSYKLIEMDYGDGADIEDEEKEEEDNKEEIEEEKENEHKSKLDERVQDLIKLIFDLKMMKNTLIQMEFDVSKSPLGKLKQSQIKIGYEVLRQIEEQIEAGKTSKLHDLTDEFYSNVPHKFGRNERPTLINNMKLLKQKLELLDALSEIEVATKILKAPKLSEQNAIVDDHYEKLKCEIVAVDKESEEYNRIALYLKNSQHKDCIHKRVELLDVYRVKKEGEEERFKKDIGNRMLLWHGSRLSNYVGILSSGLRIAPKEAPTTGFRFGKGIYFADLASLSSKYCYVDKSSPVGLLLLSDVALGKPYEAKKDVYMEKPRKGYDSTWALGTIEPDQKGHVTTEDGYVIPSGKVIDSKYKDDDVSCYEHQYVTYDVAQSQLKYLLKCKFVY